MKKIALTILLSMIYLSAHSQNQYIGIGGGISASNIIYSKPPANPAEYRIGYLFKINYEVEIFDHVYFSTGATYQDKGFTNEIGGFSSNLKVNSAHRYLGIPFGVGFQAGDNIYCKFLIQGNVSLLVSKESHVKLFSNNMKYEENTFYNTQDFSPVDFSLNPIGRFGYRFNNGFGLFLEGSFSVSVNPFLDITSNPISSVVNNYAFGVCIGVDFRI